RLRVVDRRQIGQHYGPTLQAWRERFLAHWDAARALGFDETFRRVWEFYLAYCEAGFRQGAIGDVQLVLERR
ncbi:MAG TPA: class I SAM-dependent methyltransferase, partial [Gaiellales bacterium]|nr:class I SAM-dependent methyltransferase [Gaiellales bacterium]